MAHVVFLRGANVGGHRTFRPSVLARQLGRLGATSVGAAGTFVVRGAIGASALRAEIQGRLPFETEILVHPAREIVELTRTDPFGGPPPDARRFVSVMEKPPRRPPGRPILRPAGRSWEVTLVAVRGRFALCLWRRRGRAILYPNQVVEEEFGLRATTRGWDTMLKIADLLT